MGKRKQHAADYEAADCGCALDVLARQRVPDQDNRGIDQNEIGISMPPATWLVRHGAGVVDRWSAWRWNRAS
ncbi:hypothetical protein [Rhizobium sp. Root491]|uniref:hypothetical protein n=1 Tax=Rhizobium sp. Root491 TaxID=1736548 RepID=UPI000A79BEC0|nr:hypothetical protein [Rhizobium sp. Root491]